MHVQVMTDKKCSQHREAESKLVVNPEGSRHYGKWCCSQCDKWLSHAKTPKNTEDMKKRQLEIREMVKNIKFTDVDLHRLLKLYNKTHLGVESIWYDKIKIMN